MREISVSMSATGVVKAMMPPRAGAAAQLRLFSVDSGGRETLVTTSPPVPAGAAATLGGLFQQPYRPKLDTHLLRRIFNKGGRTAWASFTAASAGEAAAQVARKDELRHAQGVLVVVFLSMESEIVANIRDTLAAIHDAATQTAVKGFVATYDETLRDEVRVSILMTGL